MDSLCAAHLITALSSDIARLKGDCHSIEGVCKTAGVRTGFCYAFYQRCLELTGRVDMDDMVPKAAALLENDSHAHAQTLQCAARAPAYTHAPGC